MKLATLEALNAARAAKRPVVVITDLGDGEQHLVEDLGTLGDEERAICSRALRMDRLQVVEERCYHPHNPPLRMVIVGAVHVAQYLVQMAQLADYEVVVIDPRGAFASEERFHGVRLSTAWPGEAMAEHGVDSRTAVILLTHDAKIDDPALIFALESEAFYIGALGSKRTHAARVERFRDRGIELGARVRAPIGLPIGSRSPAEIAFSIMAEVTQVLRKGAA